MKMKLSAILAISGLATTVASFAVLIIFAYSPNDLIRRAGFYLLIGGYATLLLGGVIAYVNRLRAHHLRWSQYIVIGLAFTLGLSIWLLSETITGTSEPWDAPRPYYVGTMFAAGVVCGMLLPRQWWFLPLAITFGQFPAAGFGLGFFPVGAIFLVIGGIPSFIGSAAGAGLSAGIRHLARRGERDTQQSPPAYPEGRADAPSGSAEAWRWASSFTPCVTERLDSGASNGQRKD